MELSKCVIGKSVASDIRLRAQNNFLFPPAFTSINDDLLA